MDDKNTAGKEEKKVENTDETAEEGVKEESSQEKINSIVQERLKRDRDTRLKKYGLNNEDELEKLIKDSKEKDSLSEKYTKLYEEVSSLKNEKVLNSLGIKEEKFDDIKFLFKGKGLELNKENLEKELKTHAEWSKNSTYKLDGNIGSEVRKNHDEKSDEEKAKELFGYNW